MCVSSGDNLGLWAGAPWRRTLRERAQGRCHRQRLVFSHCPEDLRVTDSLQFEGIQDLEVIERLRLLQKIRDSLVVAASDTQLLATRTYISTPFVPLRRQLQDASQRTAPLDYRWLKASEEHILASL
jgi:hypothetical protein